MSLGKKIRSGVFWVALASVSTRALGIVTRLVLAMLLTREAFGIVAGANLYVDALQLVREAGFGSALIYFRSRHPEEEEQAEYTTFWFVLGMALILYALTLVAAPLAVPFARHPNPLIAPVLRVLGLNLILGAFARVPMIRLAKQLDFKRRAIPDVVPNVVNVGVSLPLAVLGWGVWSLVYGRLAATLARVALAWWVTGWRPRWVFVPRLARTLFAYGKHIVGSQLLILGITNIDDVFVIRLLGWDPEGVYDNAYRLSNLPATQVTGVVNQVMFPALARVREDLQVFRHVYFQALRYVALVSVPIAGGTVLFAPDVVALIGAQKWHDMIVPMQLLAVYGLMRSLAANMGNVYRGGGRPQYLTYIAVWRLTTMALLLYPAIRWAGIVGVSALSAAVSLVDFVISVTLAHRILHTGWRDYVGALGIPLGVGALMTGLMFLILARWWPTPGLVRMIGAGIIYVGAYAGGVVGKGLRGTSDE